MNIFIEKIKTKVPRAKYNKQSFVMGLKKNAKVLDVGCGNNSPETTKNWRNDIYYVGLDIEDYNNSMSSLSRCDEYIISDPENFSDKILSIKHSFDGVISSHNLEHCNKPWKTIDAMCMKLCRGGKMYLAFPSEKTIDFPSRNGTLNFYDDPTHIFLPDYSKIIKRLEENGMRILFSRKQYKPIYYRIMGGDI